MVFLGFLLTVLAAYLLGSIPTGYLVARARGMDIRGFGSGNIGATNVFRVVGRRAGLLVLAVDFLKGLLACGGVVPFVEYGMGLMGRSLGTMQEPLTVVAGVSAILGHNYTCWLGFRGGKGIATSAGVLVAMMPWPLLVILGVWIVVFLLFRYVSLSSIAASATLPFAVWWTGGSLTLIVVTAGLAVLAIYKHRANIRRLLAGSEPRFEMRGRHSLT